jgi:DNA-binding NarL/FixJ family response regulator
MANTRVLLVDDSAAFLESATLLLSAAAGLTVVGRARSGEEAVAEAERLLPDLVLMDVQMPGIGGLEATRRIKARAHAPRVILLTMHDTPEYREAAEAAGANGFLSKLAFTTTISAMLPPP